MEVLAGAPMEIRISISCTAAPEEAAEEMMVTTRKALRVEEQVAAFIYIRPTSQTMELLRSTAGRVEWMTMTVP